MIEVYKDDDKWYVQSVTNPGYADEEVDLPMKFEVCPRCQGEGVHDHPAFADGISPEQFEEDPDFKEEYLRGAYDVQCSVCSGLRVIKVIAMEHLPADLREAVERYETQQDYERNLQDAEIRNVA